MQTIGPIKIKSNLIHQEEIFVPLATYETTIWPSGRRGAKVSCLNDDGICVSIVDERMTRSIVLEARSAREALSISRQLEKHHPLLTELVNANSRFTKLLQIHVRLVAKLLYVRLEFRTGDAAGHNMVTLAAQHIQTKLLSIYPALRYISISGNYCTDKKVSAVNSILGRGKYMIAEMTIPYQICNNLLRTTPQKMVELNHKKNLIGSIIAGSLNTANAHFANILLAIYLATGQDVANMIEGSQGITYVELCGDDLYFSVTLPNVIIGTVGHGKHLDFVQHNLSMMGCRQSDVESGINAKRLAIIIAATVLCGELSLMATLTNQNELMRAHKIFERLGRVI